MSSKVGTGLTKFVWYGGTAENKEGKKIAQQVALATAGEAKTTHREGWGKVWGDLLNGYDIVEGPDGWAVVNPIYYAPFVEFGTSRMPPQAHLRNACIRMANAHSEIKYVAAD